MSYPGGKNLLGNQITNSIAETIKVLVLSDSPSIVEAVVSVITEAQIKFDWQQVATKARYYDLLDARWDLILYDDSLAKINLSEAVSYLLEKQLEIPLIVINGKSHIPSAVAAIKAGAIDYIASDELTLLPEAIAKNPKPANYLQTIYSSHEQQLKKLITENADGIIVVSDRGIVQFVNPAALELLGKSREDLIGESLGFPVVNGDYLEVDIPLSSGQTLVAQMRVSQIQWLKANAYIVSLRNITHLKQAEAERVILLEEAQTANRAKDEFLAVLSHELRTPLNPILGWSQLLMNGQLNKPQIAKAATIINRNAQLQTQLIEDILDLSRIIRGKLKLQVTPINLTTIIDNALDTVRFTAQAKSIEIATDLEENIGSSVRGDSRRLQQIVGNLLSNAIKFTPSGGKVTISLASANREIQQSNHLEITDRAVPHARLQIKDTGKGIAPEFLPYVFDYFRQAEGGKSRTEGGLGLGLAIVRRLVELHAGEIIATSPGLGKGATFTVFLPLVSTVKELASIQSNAPRFKNLAEIKILIVDDDDASRDLLDFLLQDEGAEVLATRSATQALAAIERFQPNIMISDIGMPTMNGYDLIKKVREIPTAKEINAIAISGYASDPDRQKSLAAGFDLHLNKPLDVNNLMKIITQLVSS